MSGLTRRDVLAAGSGLVVAFALVPVARAADEKLPGSLARTPDLDSWIRVAPDGQVTVFTGKAELGQGIETAILQVAAEELDLAPQALAIVTADTARTPNEGFTAGSHSMQDSATAVMNAAAQVRALLIGEAAKAWSLPADRLAAKGGRVVAPEGRTLGYGALAARLSLHVAARPESPLTPPAQYRIIGRDVPRVDIPPKLSGTAIFVQDLRLEGMVHARAIRPPVYGARLIDADTAAIAAMPGVVKVIREGSYLAVVAGREWQAIKAGRALAGSARWQPGETLPPQAKIHQVLESYPTHDITVARTGAPAGGRRFRARYTRPYVMHGAIGPSCAVAQLKDGMLTVWTHSQGVFPLRHSLAQLLRMPAEAIRCIQVQGAGCFGHNGADDAAADAALIARALPGRPVRVQWTRMDEHKWEPYGPAMTGVVEAALDGEGRITEWNYEVWSNTHSQRPVTGGLFVQNAVLPDPLPVPPPRPLPMPAGGGDRNSIPLYDIPATDVVYHFIPKMPIRVSALRALGGQLNVFAIESFMDELALAAKTDPVAFRLKHLKDPRARAVIEAAARRFGWHTWQRRANGGRGFAFARYKNMAAYCAVALDLSVDPESGAMRLGHIAAAVDSGQAVNPDGIRNQIEGAILQAASWTLYEEVRFDASRITSADWSSYPILRFPAAPVSIAVEVLNQPGQPFLGTGEAGQGPASAAIANALADAASIRLRDLPLTVSRVRSAILARG